MVTKTYKELLEMSQGALEEYQKQLIASAKTLAPRSMVAGPVTILAGTSPWVTAIRAAETLKCPWPYGTVIKPTAFNPTFPEETRHMIVGPQRPSGGRSVMALDLAPGIEDKFRPYAHLLEDIEERWEVAEEAP